MGKIKFTKGELKKQRDALRQYERYLPTLQLKKQQLQMEILRQLHDFETTEARHKEKEDAINIWAGLLSDKEVDMNKLVILEKIVLLTRNVAGVDLPVFEKAEFRTIEYDLFITPLWVDKASETLQELISFREKINVIKDSLDILRRELRLANQRVNLFEKVKIPDAQESIRRIKIYLGDQMTNAVGRSKIAKKKIENITPQEVMV